MIKLKRFKAESQGTSGIYWNVLDTWYYPNVIVYRGHGTEAKRITRELNSQWWRNGIIRIKLDAWHDAIMDFIFGTKK